MMNILFSSPFHRGGIGLPAAVAVHPWVQDVLDPSAPDT